MNCRQANKLDFPKKFGFSAFNRAPDDAGRGFS